MDRVADEPTIEAVFRAEFTRLVRALAVSDGTEEAADAVQDAFVEANKRWERVSRLEDPGGWVRRVAVNRLSNGRRNRRRRSEIIATITRLDEPTVDDNDLNLIAVLRALPTQQRRAVCLHHVAGYSVAEVAAALRVAEGTVKSNLHDGRAHLQALLEVE